MNKKQAYIIVGIAVLALAGWGGYKYFSKKQTTTTTADRRTADSYVKNSCWLYHEYVYRVDFNDTTVSPLMFIQNSDGTFSPSSADSAGNHITGNGFFIDSTGAMLITDRMAQPWKLTNEQERPLREMLDAWLSTKDSIPNKGYHITGQTVALFALLRNYSDLIEYNVSSTLPGQQSYSIAYPVQKIIFSSVTGPSTFAPLPAAGNMAVFRIIKTVLNESNAHESFAETLTDSIAAGIDGAGVLDKITLFKGDGFFYEGSAAFDTLGNMLGNLHYEGKWQIMPINGFVQQAGDHSGEIQEQWTFDSAQHIWIRQFKKIATDNSAP